MMYPTHSFDWVWLLMYIYMNIVWEVDDLIHHHKKTIFKRDESKWMYGVYARFCLTIYKKEERGEWEMKVLLAETHTHTYTRAHTHKRYRDAWKDETGKKITTRDPRWERIDLARISTDALLRGVLVTSCWVKYMYFEKISSMYFDVVTMRAFHLALFFN